MDIAPIHQPTLITAGRSANCRPRLWQRYQPFDGGSVAPVQIKGFLLRVTVRTWRSRQQPRRKIRQLPRTCRDAKIRIRKTGALQPVIELRRPPQFEEIADIERVVE